MLTKVFTIVKVLSRRAPIVRTLQKQAKFASRRTGFARFFRPYQRGANQFYRLDQRLRPFPVNLIELREKNYLFDLGIRIFEREQKTKRLIDSLRKGVIKKFPLQSKFLIPDKKGHRIQDYVVGKVLGKGANGVAFNADLRSTETADLIDMTPKFQTESKLVLKMMFNYNAISTDSIFHEFEEEILFDKRDISKRKWLHPFIIPTERAFIAPFIDHPQENLYDAASPSKYGIDTTFCLISQKMDSDLQNYLRAIEIQDKHGVKFDENSRLLLCAQLFEAIDHLEKIGISHRDIKPDNIFVSDDHPTGSIPRLVLGDWGCATKKLVAKNEDPLMNGDLRRGNRAYMPPEIVNASRGKILDYKRADSWSISLIALDILSKGLGRGNPFYPVFRQGQRLKNESYEDCDLDFELDRPRDVPISIFGKIKQMLSSDPTKRPSMRSLCDRIFLHCFNAPQFSRDMISNFDRLDRWLVEIYGGLHTANTTIDHLKICFFRNLSFETFSYLFQNVSAK